MYIYIYIQIHVHIYVIGMWFYSLVTGVVAVLQLQVQADYHDVNKHC